MAKLITTDKTKDRPTEIYIGTYMNSHLEMWINEFTTADSLMNRLHKYMLESAGFKTVPGRKMNLKRYNEMCEEHSCVEFPGLIGHREENYLLTPDGERLLSTTLIRSVLEAHPEYAHRPFSRSLGKQGTKSYERAEAKREDRRYEEKQRKRRADEDREFARRI